MDQPDCNRKQYTVALFFTDSVESTVAFGLKMQQFYTEDPYTYDVNTLRAVTPVIAYTLAVQQNASAASSPIKGSWAQGKSYLDLLDEAWQGLCDTNDCGVLVFQVEGSNDWPFTISFTDFLALNQNASAAPGVVTCQDFSFGPSLYTALASTPPTPFTQNYFECRKSLGNALLASIGPAVASANFFSTLGWIVVGYAVIFAIRRQRRQTRVLSAHSKAVVEEALVAAKEESLVVVVQQMALAVQSLREENAVLTNKLAALESASSRRKDEVVGEAERTIVGDEIPLQIPLHEAFEQFQRLHRVQHSDHDFDLVGQAITRALRQHHGGSRTEKEEKDEEKEKEKKTEEGKDPRREAPHPGAAAVEMVDNPMRLSIG